MTTEAKSPEDQTAKIATPNPIRETISPSGIDLRPQPQGSVRISKRAAGLIILVGAVVLGLIAYGGWNRQQHATANAERGNRKVEPAKPDDIEDGLGSINPPESRTKRKLGASHAESDLQSPDPDLPAERVVVRSAPSTKSPSVAAIRELTPEERALAAAYASEQQARLAPTAIRATWATANGPGGIPASNSGTSQLEAIARGLAAHGPQTGADHGAAALSGHSEYEDQNLQSQKEAFLDKARLGNVSEDYLKSIRTPPLSRFEIRAGWEIPAALEQALNSDLPGELKALVMSNVYDTGTGLYLLIPQGARLVGTYNSRVGYGQNGVQVAWHRVIFPDGSAIDLNGMEALDAQGNAGLRDKVDHHYERLFGFAVLTSTFDAALAITQGHQQSVLVYPSPTQDAESAAGREVSQIGTQITRKNLNVQPTIKIPAGYKFTVRVNRDILFEEPYQPVQPIDSYETEPVNFRRGGRSK